MKNGTMNAMNRNRLRTRTRTRTKSRRQKSATLLQTDANEVFDGCLRTEDGLGLANRIVGFDLFESKGHQGQDSVIDLLFVG